MRTATSKARGQNPMMWKPTANKRGWILYDLPAWRDGVMWEEGKLSAEIHAVAFPVLGEYLDETQRQVLIDRKIVLLGFRFGLRGEGWGKELYFEMGETLKKLLVYLLGHGHHLGGGIFVRRQLAQVACALAPDKERVEQIVAQLEIPGNNEQGRYYPLALTDEMAAKKNVPEQKPTSESTSPPPMPVQDLADPGLSHQFFHDTVAKFTADAEATVLRLHPHLKILLVTSPPATYEGKRNLVEKLNKLFHAADIALKHPERNEPVTLLALSGGARSKKGYIQIRPTKGGDLLSLPDADPQLIHFRRYHEASSRSPQAPAK